MTSFPAWWPNQRSAEKPAGAGLWDSLKAQLDIQKYTPAQAPGIVSREVTESGGRHFMLKNPRTHTYVRLTPEEFWVWQRLDGRRSVEQHVVDFFTEFGSFGYGAIAGMLDHLRESHMLNEKPRHLYSQVSQSLREEGTLQKLTRLGGAALTTEFIIKDLDRRLERLYRGGGWLLYTWPFQAIFLLVSVVGAYFFVRLAVDPQNQILRSGSAIQIGLLAYVPIVIHEFGHALTAKFVGCEVYRGGAMLWYGLPAAFVETNDLWMFGKRERMIVTWAGSYTGYIIGGACSIAVYAFPDMPPGLRTALMQIAFLGVLTTTLNMLPGLKLDGYYLLSDALEIPRLRERSLDFLVRQLPRRVATFQGWRQWRNWKRQDLIFLGFGVLVIASIIFFTYASAAFWDQQTSTSVTQILDENAGWLTRLGNILMLLLAVSILAYSLASLARSAAHFIRWTLRQGWVRTRGRAAALVLTASFVLMLVILLVLPRLSRLLLTMTALGAFALAAWLALDAFRKMRGSVHASMWLLAAVAFVLGALGSLAGPRLRFPTEAGGVLLSTAALLDAGYLRRGLRGSWRELSLALVGLGTFLWVVSLVTVPAVQTVGALLIAAGLIHWRMRPATPLQTHAALEGGSTRARMADAMDAIRATVLDELELDFGRGSRKRLEARAYRGKRRRVDSAAFARTDPGLSPEDYGSSMALSLESLLDSVSRVAGRRFARRALALGYDRLDWELQEIVEDYVLTHVEEAQGLSTALAKTRADLDQLLRSVPLFADMTDLEIRALGAEFTSQVFKRGEVIVRAGSDSANFYVIFAGQAEVLDASGRTVDRLSRGDHFGEAALLAHARVQSTLRALTALEVLRLEEYGFDRLLRTSARFDAASGESLKRVRVLRRIPLFAAFDGRDLTRLAAKMRRVEAQASEEIVRQGETGESFYVIDSGKVSVQVDNVQRATLGPGEYFGEIALMMDAPRTATVVALQPTVMLLMEAGDFKAMLRDSKAIEQGMQRAGSRRVLSNERWMRRARQPDAAG